MPVGQDIIEETVSSSHMICEPAEDSAIELSGEFVGNISPVRGEDDDDDDDMAVDGGDGSSRTSLSPMGSIDGDVTSSDQPPVSFVSDDKEFPLQ